MNKRLKPVPKFANEAAERAFWKRTTQQRIWIGRKLSPLFSRI